MRSSAIAFKEKVKDDIVKVIEIGVCTGENAKKLWDNFRISNLYLIDWYRNSYSEHIYEWIKSIHLKFNEEKRATIIINNSLDISHLFKNDSIDYIYLDGDHNPLHVYAEMEHYWKKVKVGGMLAGHDYDENKPERVKEAVEKFCKTYKLKYEWAMNKDEDVGDWWIWKRS